jgi:hypothetical protein
MTWRWKLGRKNKTHLLGGGFRAYLAAFSERELQRELQYTGQVGCTDLS